MIGDEDTVIMIVIIINNNKHALAKVIIVKYTIHGSYGIVRREQIAPQELNAVTSAGRTALHEASSLGAAEVP